MKVIKKRLDDLKHPEKNVRIHSEQQIRELKRSLEKFGQTRALVVDENNVILIGNGLYEAMVSLGYQEAFSDIVANLIRIPCNCLELSVWRSISVPFYQHAILVKFVNPEPSFLSFIVEIHGVDCSGIEYIVKSFLYPKHMPDYPDRPE